jgi:N-acetylglutamate synthase-like GNAT family acetyltransferase
VKITLRNATPQDTPAIRQLIYLVKINPIGLDWRHFILAVDESDLLVGCSQIKTHFDGTRELASLAVQPEHRGQGAARALVDYMQAHNPPPLYLTCRSSLQPLYEKFGFHIVPDVQMPMYFRRIKRIFSVFRFIANLKDHLLVMVWDNALTEKK